MSENILLKSGIDISSPHSTRSASTSIVKTMHLPLDTVLKAEGWRSMNKFAKHYDKSLENFELVNAILEAKK